jgi:hypothetical protein
MLVKKTKLFLNVYIMLIIIVRLSGALLLLVVYRRAESPRTPLLLLLLLRKEVEDLLQTRLRHTVVLDVELCLAAL